MLTRDRVSYTESRFALSCPPRQDVCNTITERAVGHITRTQPSVGYVSAIQIDAHVKCIAAMAHNLPYLFPSNGLPQQHQYPQPAHHQPSSHAMPISSAPQTMPQSQLPGLDLASVLQGVTPEQLASIIQLYQAGQIPLPPAQTPRNGQAPAMATPPVPQLNGTANAKPQDEDPMALDRSEGEWTDGEAVPQAAPDFLRPPPTGPRKRSGSINTRPGYGATDKRAKHQPSPPRQPDSYDRRRPPGYLTSSPPRSHARQRKTRHDAAKTFILAAYRAGFSFHELDREFGDAKMLQVLFKELGLVVPQTSAKPRKEPAACVVDTKGAAPIGGSPFNPTKASSAVKLAAKPVVKPAAASKAPETAARAAYLAKLQAVKNKKHQDSLAKSNASPVEAPIVNQTSSVQQAALVPTVPTKEAEFQQPGKAKVQTDLIRKRLEALKEERARKQKAERLANSAAANATIAPPAQLGVNPAEYSPSLYLDASPAEPEVSASATAKTPQNATPVQPGTAFARPIDFTSQFPGLPGLFMSGTPIQAPYNPGPPAPPASDPVAAPINTAVDNTASDDLTSADMSSPAETAAVAPSREASLPGRPAIASSGQATPKHLFNQSKYDSNDDSVIIHISDEEESELDDEMEDEVAAPPPALKSTMPAAVKPGPLRNFPVPYSANASAPGTPGAMTPGGTAYQRKLQEIDEMHRRIAEMQKKPKAKANVSIAPEPVALPSVQAAAPAQSITASLPGLSSNSTVTFPQPMEQQPAETSQQMEVKLAKLQQEADIISEQRQLSQATQSAATTLPNVTSVAENAASAAPSDQEEDDDDDAMDLSSGDDSESDEEVDETGAPSLATSEDHAHGSQQLAATDPVSLAQTEEGSTSSDDSSDSSTESDEESDEEYEPALSAPDVVTEPVAHPDPAVLPISGLPMSPTPPQQEVTGLQDVDLAPELQPSASEQEVIHAPSEVRRTTMGKLFAWY